MMTMFQCLGNKDDVEDYYNDEEDVQLAKNFVKYLKFFGYIVPVGERLNPLKILIVFLSMQTVTLGMITFSVNYLKYNKFEIAPLGDAIAGNASVLMAFFIQYTFLLKHDGIHRLLLEFGALKKDEVSENWRESHRRMNKIINYFFLLIFVIFISIIGILLLTKCEEYEENDCGLLITGRLSFVNVYVTPNRQIFMIVQTVNAFQNGLLTCSVAGVFITFSRCLILLLEKLQKMFMEIPEMSGRAERKAHIKKCVLYHYKILNLRDKFAKYSTDTHFYLTFFASINISLNAYSLVVMGIRLQMLLHFVIYAGFIFVICFAGEKLIEASDDLWDIIYQSIPLDGDNATAGDLCFILLCSSRGIFIPAGKLAKVGFLRLQDLMNKSYSYFTMLVNT